jgi:plastocyanin
MRKIQSSLAAKTALTLLLVAALGLAGRRAAAADANPPAAEVKIDNFSFTPQEIKVKAGTTVIWTNRDDIPHTVTSTDLIFKSKTLDTDDKFTMTFAKPGTYPYFCSIHPKMTGKVIVE